MSVCSRRSCLQQTMLRCIVLFGGGVSFFVFSLFFPLVLGWFVVLFFLRFRSLHPKVTLCNPSLSSLNEKHVFHVLKKGKAKRFLGVLRGCITRFLNHVILCYILPCLSSFFLLCCYRLAPSSLVCPAPSLVRWVDVCLA
jgi:hypothetical protein